MDFRQFKNSVESVQSGLWINKKLRNWLRWPKQEGPVYDYNSPDHSNKLDADKTGTKSLHCRIQQESEKLVPHPMPLRN